MTLKVELEPHQILLIDDDTLMSDVMSAMLEEFGFRVTTVKSGEEAEAVLRSGRPFDLI